MEDVESDHDPPRESMREVKKGDEDAAEKVLKGLEDMPSAFDAETVGSAETARAFNDALSTLFKNTARQAADLRVLADKIDPETGTFDGVSIERQQAGPTD
ncbi:hypothetical protein [Sciscionella marina]|uniref:hypothetical protein n=1 Tax=Sciscionella marina TaxID=508770 RepID=UPI0003A58864|nr:hypothetical protein [Sciscionella marina]